MNDEQKNQIAARWPNIKIKDQSKTLGAGFWSVREFYLDSIKAVDTRADVQALMDNLLSGSGGIAGYNNISSTKTSVCLGSLVKEFAYAKYNTKEAEDFCKKFLNAYNNVAITRYATGWRKDKTKAKEDYPDMDYDITPTVMWQDLTIGDEQIYRKSTFDKAVGWSSLMCSTEMSGINFWTYTEKGIDPRYTYGRPTPWTNRYARFWLQNLGNISKENFWKSTDNVPQ